MLMARKKTAKKKAGRKGEAPAPAPERPPMEAEKKAEPLPKAEEPAPADVAREPEAPMAGPVGGGEQALPQSPKESSDSGGLMKGILIIALLASALFLAYYFITMPENAFVPGSDVDAETFKNIFLHSQNVFIVMDVRGVTDDAVSNNVLQCGVDFASSSGMGGKVVTPISFGNDGCVAPDGVHKAKDCFAMLKDGVTIYVKEGQGGVKYYSNGMVVTVGREYVLGTCGIKRY